MTDADQTIEEVLREKVGELAGFASVSWDENGVFMSEAVIEQLNTVMDRVLSALAEARLVGQRDEREACIALVETVAQSGAYIDYVEIDSVIAAIRARSDGGES